MTQSLHTNPFRSVTTSAGKTPFYVLRFNKDGHCESTQARDHLLHEVANATDVYVFSHGWNNDWTDATNAYDKFIQGVAKTRRDHHLPAPDPYKPILVGIFWPSIALAFGEPETGPHIAGAPAHDDLRESIDAICAELPPSEAQQFRELAARPSVDEDGARKMAGIAQHLATADPGENPDAQPNPHDLVESWEQTRTTNGDGSKRVGTLSGETPTGPSVAGLGGFAKRFDPRGIVRALTVWTMKDRAGRVGSKGVAPVIEEILRGSQARLHLIGHSYGCKVILSCLAAPAALARPAHSTLLLQPAVSHLCFANHLPKTGQPGGYNRVVQRVKRPILSTFSRQDVPLTRFFHLALRRTGDYGEAKIAAANEPPSPYAALGGYGPRHASERTLPMNVAGTPYTLDPGTRLVGLDATGLIQGHGDVNNPATWWALCTLAQP